MGSDHTGNREQHSAVERARASTRRALERAEDPAVRRELREVLQMLYAVSDEGAAHEGPTDR